MFIHIKRLFRTSVEVHTNIKIHIQTLKVYSKMQASDKTLHWNTSNYDEDRLKFSVCSRRHTHIQLGCASQPLALLRHCAAERASLTSAGARFHRAGAREKKNLRACSARILGNCKRPATAALVSRTETSDRCTMPAVRPAGA